MRFVANICHQATTLARVSVDDAPDRTAAQTAFEGRERLTRDANRHRSDRLSDAVLEELCTVYGDVIAQGTLDRQGRTLTCVVRGGRVSKMEGHITLLTGPDDLVMLVEALDDRWIAERERFVDDIMKRA